MVLKYCLNWKPASHHGSWITLQPRGHRSSCYPPLLPVAKLVHTALLTRIRRHHHRAAVPSFSQTYHPIPLSETMKSMFSATQPENACSGRHVDPNVPWAPSPRPQPYTEFNPYETESTNVVDNQHRSDGPVIPVSWGLEVSLSSLNGSGTAASMRGVRFVQNAKVPCDPFNRKRKRWSLMKKLRRYLGTTAFPA